MMSDYRHSRRARELAREAVRRGWTLSQNASRKAGQCWRLERRGQRPQLRGNLKEVRRFVYAQPELGWGDGS